VEGRWTEVAKGTSIGACRLILLQKPVRTTGLRLRIEKSPVCVAISELGVFALAR
jgi:alpha-L-fucosidase